MEVIKSTIEHLKQFLPFQKMEEADLQFLASNIQVSYFSKEEVILDIQEHRPPDVFFIVKQGIVESQREARDSEFHKNAYEFEEGEGFPFGPLLSKRPNSSQFIAYTDCFLYQIPAQVFYQLHNQSSVFRDYCEMRIALLLEESKRIIQNQYVRASSEQQTLSMPLADLIRREPYSCPPNTSIRDILDIMDKTGIGSMVAVNEQKQPLGIFTLHDVLRRIAIPQSSLDMTIEQVMTHKPITLTEQDLAYEAALIMAKHGFRHILIVDHQDGRLVGVISEKDLFSLQRVGLRQLSSNIQNAAHLEALQTCVNNIHELTENMMAQGVSIAQLTHIISTLNDLVVERIIQLQQERHPGVKTIDFCWMAMGSEGRLEQMLYTDQDNGIIFKQRESLEEDRTTLLKFAHDVNHDLDHLGFPLCKGDIMAMNPKWCLSDKEWRHLFEKWMNVPDPQNLLNSSIFFDFRGIAGNTALSESLRDFLNAEAPNQKMFLRFLTQNALSNRPPLGMIRDFSTNDNNAIDLKINGAALLVDAARILALQTGSGATNTVQRFKDAGQAFGLSEKQLNGCIESFLFIQLLRMQHHFELSKAGKPLSNEIDPSKLNSLNTRVLRETFRLIRTLQGSLSNRYRL